MQPARSPRKKALFVCAGNAGCSQLAQALYEARGGRARSAGTEPAAELHEAVVEALAEVGIDVSHRRPRALGRDDVEWAEVVVAIGGAGGFPVPAGRECLRWDLVDPVGLCLEEVRELRAQVEGLVATLDAGSP